MKKSILLFAFTLMVMLGRAQWVQTGGPHGGAFCCMAVDGSNIFIGTGGGIYLSTNNGVSWASANTGIPNNYGILSFAIFGTKIFAGSYAGIYASTNNGASWTSSCTGILSSTNVYSIVVKGTNIFAATFNHGIFSSSDTGATWTAVNSVPCIGCDSTVNILAVNGTDIFAGTQNGLFKSSNNGASWTNTGLSASDVESILIHGNDIFVGTYDGLYYSSNYGVNWTQLANGLSSNNVKAIAFDGTNLFAGTSSALYKSTNNGASWTMMQNGILYSTYNTIVVDGTDIFALSNELGIFHSNNQGVSWTLMDIGLTQTEVYSLASCGSKMFAHSYKGFFTSSDNGNTWELSYDQTLSGTSNLIVVNGAMILTPIASSSIYMSTDSGATWASASNGLQGSISYIACEGSSIYAGSNLGVYLSTDAANSWTLLNPIDPNNGNSVVCLAVSGTKIYAATNNGVYLSPDNGITWTFLTGFSGGESCKQIVTSGNYVYLVTIDHIYRSLNDGATWTIISHGFHSPMINSIVVSGSNIFAATDDGLFFSFNNGLSWTYKGTGMVSDRFCSVAIGGNYVYAGINYDGVWRRNISDFNIPANHFSGNVFNDINNDGERDNGEPAITNILLRTKVDNWNWGLDNNGNYNAFSTSQTDSIFVDNPPLYSTVNPHGYAVTTLDTGKNFAVHFTPNVHDLRITITNQTPARPGFNDVLHITYENIGTATMNGNVTLDFPATINFTSSIPAQSSITGNTITWNFTNLTPLEQRDISITFNVPSSLPIGTLLVFYSTVNPVVGDTIPLNNHSGVDQTVSGSFDPNEKEVSPANGFTPQQLLSDEKLVYTIHFQNTGTDTAFNVVIVDTLSPKLDATTFEILSSSHPCTFSMRGAGIVEFTFSNILLPDSNVNFVGSNGFVKYAVKPKSTLILGDSINNTAYIYFDFNLPVATNTTSTEIATLTGIGNIMNNADGLFIYPNPANTSITIDITNYAPHNTSAEIYSIDGQLIQAFSVQKQQTVLNISTFSRGMYFVKMINENGIEVKKFVKE